MRNWLLCPPASAEVAALQETGRCCLAFGEVTADLQANEQLLCLGSRLLAGACLGLADAHGALALTRNVASKGLAMGVPRCDTPSASISSKGHRQALRYAALAPHCWPIQWPAAGALVLIYAVPLKHPWNPMSSLSKIAYDDACKTLPQGLDAIRWCWGKARSTGGIARWRTVGS